MLARLERSSVRVGAGLPNRVGTEKDVGLSAMQMCPCLNAAQPGPKLLTTGVSVVPVQTGCWASRPRALPLQPKEALLLNRAYFIRAIHTWWGWGKLSLTQQARCKGFPD